VLLVLVYHFFVYGGPPAGPGLDHAVYAVAQSGWMGVDLFFVLSGFLITGILYDAKGGPGYFRNFYIRRVLRIFPLYYGVLILMFVVLPHFSPDSERLRLLGQDAVWYWTYLVNVRIADAGWGRFPALGHFWSLAVEEQFYLVWPVVVLLLSRRALTYTCLGCLVAGCLIRAGLNWSWPGAAAYVLTPARADTLALGGFVALVVRSPNGIVQLRRWGPRLLAGSTAAVVGVFLWRGPDYHDAVVKTLGLSLLAILFAGLVAVAVSSPERSLTQRVLGTPLLVSFGRYSYALYVFHHVLLYFKPTGWSAERLPMLWGSIVPARVTYAVLGIAITFGLAMLSWHAYEKQFLKLKRLFPYSGTSGLASARRSGIEKTRGELVVPNALVP
jgi:peptidoglycan/LPS O-acetylase OafA/YrhL